MTSGKERTLKVGRCVVESCCFLPFRLFGGEGQVFFGGRRDFGRLWKSLARIGGEVCFPVANIWQTWRFSSGVRLGKVNSAINREAKKRGKRSSDGNSGWC